MGNEEMEQYIVNMDILNVGKLKKVLENVPDHYQIAFTVDGVNIVAGSCRVDQVMDCFGYVLFGEDLDDEDRSRNS